MLGLSSGIGYDVSENEMGIIDFCRNISMHCVLQDLVYTTILVIVVCHVPHFVRGFAEFSSH